MERTEGGHIEGALAEAERLDIPEAPSTAISTSKEMGSEEPQVVVGLGAESILKASDSGAARGAEAHGGVQSGKAPGGGQGRKASGGGRSGKAHGRGRGRKAHGRGRSRKAHGSDQGPEASGDAQSPKSPGPGGGRGQKVPGDIQSPEAPAGIQGPEAPGSTLGPEALGCALLPEAPGSIQGPEAPCGALGQEAPDDVQGQEVPGVGPGPEASDGAQGRKVPVGIGGPEIHWVRARGSRRRPRGRSIEKSMQAMSLKQDESQDIEEQFILRLPPEHAYAVRKIIHSRDGAMKDKLKFNFSSDGHHAVVQVDDVSLPAKLVNLPCVIGSLKTVDRKTFYKTADISQMLVCSADSAPRSPPEEPVTFTDPTVTGSVEGKTEKKKYNWKHGITPPLKNVRKKRFRKTTKKLPEVKKMDDISFSEYTESPAVEKEVKRLLCSDAEAVSVRWEVITDGETKEIESQGCILDVSETPQTSVPSSSGNEMFQQMFDDPGSSGSNMQNKGNEIEAEDANNEEESDEDEEDEDDEEEEEEKEIDNYEANLERELQIIFIQPSFFEESKDHSSIITRIQKLIYYKEKKLQYIYKKAHRQKELLRNVENLTLKRHFQYVLEKLNIMEEQKCDEIYHLQEQLKCFLKA